MRPTVATVVTPRPWEGHLVRAATETGLVRLVARCYNPSEVPAVDVIVAGSEIPWIGGAVIREWRLRGLAVIGVFPLGDRPAIAMFCRSEVDQLFAETADPITVLRAVRDLVALASPDGGRGA